MGTQESRRHRKERGARSGAENVQAEDIPLARPPQNVPKGKTLIEIAKERQLLQNPDTALPTADDAVQKDQSYPKAETTHPQTTPAKPTQQSPNPHIFSKDKSTTESESMPLNLFSKPSKSTTSRSPGSFPSPTTTNHVATHLLRLAYPSVFPHLLPLDTAQFLTKFYSTDPPSTSTERHWDWIGCTFNPEQVQSALDTLETADSPLSLPLSYRQELYELAQKIWRNQQGLQKKIYDNQGAAPAKAYRRQAEERKRYEVERLARVVKARVEGKA
ncbi:MAG: hypothetical protein LQ342_002932 [Letrouitia transgressa]|nr:MAG: hypothetical protein LQ342_002932 [Letrouitia transgressa]